MKRPLCAVLRVDSRAPEARFIEQAAACLREGGLVAFPTETVYGLGARADAPDAMARLISVKGRPPEKPFAILVADAAAAATLAGAIPPAAQRLMQRYWPGPLTLVLPAKAGGTVPPPVGSAYGRERRRRSGPQSGPPTGGGTVGLRCPDHPVAQALVRASGVPLAAPSANRAGGAEPRTAADVQASLGGEIDLMLDGGPAREGRPSTVVRVSGKQVDILREGVIPSAAILACTSRNG